LQKIGSHKWKREKRHSLEGSGKGVIREEAKKWRECFINKWKKSTFAQSFAKEEATNGSGKIKEEEGSIGIKRTGSGVTVQNLLPFVVPNFPYPHYPQNNYRLPVTSFVKGVVRL